MTLRVCSPHLGLAPESGSGGEVYERELLTRLAGHVELHLILARGKPTPWDGRHDVFWLSPQGGFHALNPDHVRIHRFPIRRGLRWWVAPWVVPRAIQRCVAGDGLPGCGIPDLLRVHSVRGLGLACLRARRGAFARAWELTRVPLIAHWHHLDPGWAWLEGPVLRRMDHVITVSEFSKSQLTGRLRVDPARITVVPNGIEERFCPAGPAHLPGGWPGPAGPVVLALGVSKRRKNPFALLEIWPLVLRAVPEATLLVAGAGPLIDQLETRFCGLGHGVREHVLFVGHVPEAQKPALYRVADVFLFPSRLEGFGRPVAEAMATGLPVVASNGGAIPEVVLQGEGGLLYGGPDLPELLANSVVWLLQHLEVRAGMGRRNAARVNRLYRWPGVVKRVVAGYEQTAQCQSRKRGGSLARSIHPGIIGLRDPP